jgi:hypothetical protein
MRWRKIRFTGTAFVFRSKRADRLKILFWDGSELVMAYKRLEKSTYTSPAIRDGGYDAEPGTVQGPVCRIGLAPGTVVGGPPTGCGRVSRPRECPGIGFLGACTG